MARIGRPPEFWKHFTIGAPDECWLWRGPQSKDGYGRSNRQGAHRVVYKAMVGPISRGLALDHVAERGCTSTLCVNPGHLEPVTHAENMRRRAERTVECRRGHPFTPANTIIKATGTKTCRTCVYAAQARYRARVALARQPVKA